jgi:hypothetical protein
MLCCVFRSVRFFLTRLFPLSSGLIRFFYSRGSWGVDLQAGSDFGYKLLFIILLAGLFAVVVQVIFFLLLFHIAK